MKYRFSLVACARWETPYIGEWLSYHRSIGFDHAYLYCNDDDPAAMYQAVLPFLHGPDPFVTWRHSAVQGTQWWIYRHFLEHHAAETDWISMLDIDEFICLRRHRGLAAFVADYPGADSIYLNWAFFGHNGFDQRPAGSVLLNYTRRQDGLDVHTKHLTRTAAIDPALLRRELRDMPGFVAFNHGWNADTGGHMRRVNVLGDDMAEYYDDPAGRSAAWVNEPGRAEAIYRTALIHHYAFKSAGDFLHRYHRGTGGDHAAQLHWKQVWDSGGADAFLSTINCVEDNSLHDYWSAQLAPARMLALYPPPPGEDVALGKPCAQSSVPDWLAAENATACAGRATSGEIGASYAFHTDLETDPWWQVDLLRRHAIAEVRIYNRMDHSQHVGRAANLQIWLSDDGEAWRHALRKDDGIAFGGIDGRPLRWRPRTPEAARFVRISLIGRQYLHLNQVQVFGPEAPA